MESTTDQATAYHEAGHAVLAFVLDRPVQCVSILPDRDHLGICEFGKAVYRPSEDWLEREILIALGGIAAEARSSPNNLRISRAVCGRFSGPSDNARSSVRRKLSL